MADEQHIKSRRDVLKTMFRSIGMMGVGGAAWGSVTVRLKASEMILRPPGALDEEFFVKTCLRCGTCVEACPHDTLKLATLDDHTAIGTPFFEPGSIPCYMCPDVPCVPACPGGALDVQVIAKQGENIGNEKPDINKAKMGVAVIDEETCLAYWGSTQCDACYRSCPLIGEAITLEYKRDERTGKYAFPKPVVHHDICTGCGLCEHACVVEKAAIFVLPRKIASSNVGTRYIKEWDSADDDRLKNLKVVKTKESSPQDVLNDWRHLLDEK